MNNTIPPNQAVPPTLRIGQGYDVHALVAGRPLILGGVQIPFNMGLQGHSDADALLHAITDAVLGALAWGDIGSHFPDTDPIYKGANSATLLKTIVQKATQTGWGLINLDATVIAQQPKLNSFLLPMRNVIANLFDVPLACVNVKAKTNEKLGYLGRGQAIEAQAVVLMQYNGPLPEVV